MVRKLTYEALEQKLKELEKEVLEHKQAEEALRDSEERYRLLFEQSPIGIGLASLDGKVISGNRAMEAITGYSIEELRKTNLADTYENREDRESLVEAVNRDGDVVNYPVRLNRKDGTPYDALLTVSRVHNCGGEDLFQTICIDITERKQAEEALQRAHNELERRVKERTAELAKANEKLQAEITEHEQTEQALRESESKYRELADLLPQTVFEIDEKGNFTFANRYGFESSGYSQEDIDRGLNALQLFIPQDRERVARNIRKTLSGERSEGREYTALRKDGTTFPVLVYSSPIIRDDKPVGLRGIVIDMAERKRAQEALRDSEEKYRGLFERASDGIFLADAETHIILDANRQAERLIGRPREELIGMPQSKLHPPEHAQYYEEKLRKYVRKGRVLDLQAEVMTKDGGIVPVFISATVVTIHGRQVMQGLFRDATEERGVLNLAEEITTKHAIDKAKRLLMDRHGISEKEAMSRLQKESRRQRRKVKETAQAVISSELILN